MIRYSSLFLPALATGCFAEVDVDADGDGDGLIESEEAELGTDPANADSDGDGWDDGAEVAQYTDPLSEGDHPYTGGWTIDACRNDVESSGQSVGEVAQNFELLDQYAEPVKLHDFCDRVVMLIFAAFW